MSTSDSGNAKIIRSERLTDGDWFAMDTNYIAAGEMRERNSKICEGGPTVQSVLYHPRGPGMIFFCTEFRPQEDSAGQSTSTIAQQWVTLTSHPGPRDHFYEYRTKFNDARSQAESLVQAILTDVSSYHEFDHLNGIIRSNLTHIWGDHSDMIERHHPGALDGLRADADGNRLRQTAIGGRAGTTVTYIEEQSTDSSGPSSTGGPSGDTSLRLGQTTTDTAASGDHSTIQSGRNTSRPAWHDPEEPFWDAYLHMPQ